MLACGCTGKHIQLVAINLNGWAKLMENMAKGLHDGTVKPEDLSKEYILNTYKELYKGASEGYGEKFTSFNTEPDESRTIQALKQNIYMFSQAKNFGLFTDMQGLLEKNGKIQSFNDFKNDVLRLNPTYNKNYLQAEFQTARATANHVRNWQQFEANKDLFPNLRYKTVGDARVREQHELLNNHVAAVDDAFWLTYYPPNGWRCRCFVEQTNEGVSDKKINANEASKFGVPEQFKMNAAKEQQVFDKQKNPFFALTNNVANKKIVEINMERNKLDAPFELIYTASNGAKVRKSIFADNRNKETEAGDLRAAIQIVNQLSVNVDIMPLLNGHILKKVKSPDYKIDGKIADRKGIQGVEVNNALSKAAKQNAEIVILDLFEKPIDVDQVKIKLKNVLKNDVHTSIKEIWIIKTDGTIVQYNRIDFK